MTENNSSEFQTPNPIYSQLIHQTLSHLSATILENKKDLHRRLDGIADDVKEAHTKISAVKEKVDTMGLETVLGNVGRLEEVVKDYERRLVRLEGWHTKVVGIGAFVGFVLAIALTVTQLLKLV